MRFDPAIIKQQIDNLLVQYPRLADDEILLRDMIEGSTDFIELMRNLERRRQDRRTNAKALTIYIDELNERKGRLEDGDEAIRSLMFKMLQSSNLKKLELPEATLSIRNGTPFVIITDEAALPKEYIRVRTEPNKQLIKDAIKNGDHIEGAMLSNAEPTISIRVK